MTIVVSTVDVAIDVDGALLTAAVDRSDCSSPEHDVATSKHPATTHVPAETAATITTQPDLAVERQQRSDCGGTNCR